MARMVQVLLKSLIYLLLLLLLLLLFRLPFAILPSHPLTPASTRQGAAHEDIVAIIDPPKMGLSERAIRSLSKFLFLLLQLLVILVFIFSLPFFF